MSQLSERQVLDHPYTSNPGSLPGITQEVTLNVPDVNFYVTEKKQALQKVLHFLLSWYNQKHFKIYNYSNLLMRISLHHNLAFMAMEK